MFVCIFCLCIFFRGMVREYLNETIVPVSVYAFFFYLYLKFIFSLNIIHDVYGVYDVYVSHVVCRRFLSGAGIEGCEFSEPGST